MLSDHSLIKNQNLPDVIRNAADFMEHMKIESIRIEEEKLKKKEQHLAEEIEKMSLNESNIN